MWFEVHYSAEQVCKGPQGYGVQCSTVEFEADSSQYAEKFSEVMAHLHLLGADNQSWNCSWVCPSCNCHSAFCHRLHPSSTDLWAIYTSIVSDSISCMLVLQ